MTKKFDYSGLFAKTIPEPQAISAVKREKYDFAVAYPDPGSLPLIELQESLAGGLAAEGRDLAVYPHPAGYPPLREFVSQKLTKDRKMRVEPDEIILTEGSGQAIHMVLETILDPGDVVLVEEFTYSGTLRTLRRFRADIRGVQCDEQGMLPDALRSAIKGVIREHRIPKIIYTIPTHQNPQGWTMTLERREEMLAISEAYNVAILEDDCYVDLRFEGSSVPAIHSLDRNGSVTYVGSFSKIIAPGVRLGYVTAPGEILDRARVVKSGSGVNQLSALAVHRYSTSHLNDHISDLRGVFRKKRDAMLGALGENFGPNFTWSIPKGGLYIWLKMPPGADAVAALPVAMDAGVGYQPGPLFSPDGETGRDHIRLCYGFNTPEEIYEGIGLLGRILTGQETP